MKRRKLVGILLFGFIFLFASSTILLNSSTYNDETGSCWCHDPSGNISITLVNETTIDLEGKTQFILVFYASTTLSGSVLTIRFLSAVSISTDPDMISANQGIEDGSGEDPDGLSNEEVGNSTHPIVVNVTNAPSDFSIIIVAAYADAGAIMSTVTISFGDVETTWEWFMRTQLPILVGIFIFFGLGVFASFVLKKK